MQDFPTKPIIESEFLGYDDLHPTQLLAPGKFTKCDNALVSDNKINKVTGSTSIAPAISGNSFNGLGVFEKISASVKYLVVNINAASTADIYSWSGSGSFAKINGANTFTNTTPMYFETANDSLFGFNEIEAFDWDGTTFTKNRSGIPLGNYANWFHNFLFVAKTTANPNRLYFSNLGDPKTFVGANYVDINPGDNDEIMGLGSLQDELFAFKRETIWSITGWSGSTFAATTVATENTNVRLVGYGCVSPGSIVPVGNDVYFMSFLSGTPQIRSLKKTQFAATLGGGIISYDITGTMQTINKTYIAGIVGVFDGRYCRWAIPTGSSTVNNTFIVLDTWGIRKFKGITIYPWTTETGKNASYIVTSTISGSSVKYFTDSSLVLASPLTSSGLVFKFDTSVYTNNGTNITMDIITRSFMTDPSRKTKWKYMYLKYDTGTSSTLNINAKPDSTSIFTNQAALSLISDSPGLGPTGTFTLGVSTLGGALVKHNRVTFQHIVANQLQLEFTETSANACGIYEYSIYTIPKGLRAN